MLVRLGIFLIVLGVYELGVIIATRNDCLEERKC